MVLVILIPVVVLAVFGAVAIIEGDASPLIAGVSAAMVAFVFMLVIAVTIGEVQEANFVQVEQYSGLEINGEFARAYLDDGSVAIEFAYSDEKGVTVVERATSEGVIITIDESAEPTVEVYENKNGTWYSLNEGSVQYRLTIPHFNSDIAIPVVRGK